MLVSSSGRVEKIVEAHKGAVLGALWSHDGTALITSNKKIKKFCELKKREYRDGVKSEETR